MFKLDSKKIWAISIFAIALAVRLIYFFQVKSNFPGWDTPTIDPLFHDLWAKQIAGGDILGSGPFFRAPLYAYFLGLIYSITGSSLITVKIIQHFIGSFTSAFIFLFTDRFFGRRIAIMAGIIAAFNWVFIYFEDELLLDSLLAPMMIAILWLLIRAYKKPSFSRFLSAGLILGLASITRPNFLILLPAIFIWFIFIFHKQYKNILIRYLGVLIGCFLIILPVTIRNAVVGDDFVLIASQGGINFYIGNNEHANGASAIMPEFGPTWQYADCEYLARYETGNLNRELKPSEVSSFYFGKGIDYIFSKPGEWLGLMFKKLSFFWSSYEISNNQNLYFFKKYASVTKLLPPFFMIISPLSIIGLWYLFRREKYYHIIGYSIVFYMVGVLFFFVNSRFRLPILTLLIILASLAFFEILDMAKQRENKKLIPVASAFILLIGFTNIDLFKIKHNNFAMSHFSLGNVYLKKGLSEKALKEYDNAIALADCVPSAHMNKGIIYFGRLDFEKARKEFELELEKCVNSPKSHNNLSVIDRLESNPESALEHASIAVSQAPQYLEAHVNKILALRMLGDDSTAYIVADNLTITFPDFLPGYYFKGKIQLDNGNIIEAEREFQYLINQGPVNIIEKYDLSTLYTSQTSFGYKPEKMPGLAYYELGLMRVREGKIDLSLNYFRSATEFIPDFPDAWSNLALTYDYLKDYQNALLAFKKAIELDPDNAVIYYNFGLTLGKVGLLKEAVEVFRIALEINPEFKDAREKYELTLALIEQSKEN
jgi:tetratricopeptide (TPR) repeat protein